MQENFNCQPKVNTETDQDSNVVITLKVSLINRLLGGVIVILMSWMTLDVGPKMIEWVSHRNVFEILYGITVFCVTLFTGYAGLNMAYEKVVPETYFRIALYSWGYCGAYIFFNFYSSTHIDLNAYKLFCDEHSLQSLAPLVLAIVFLSEIQRKGIYMNGLNKESTIKKITELVETNIAIRKAKVTKKR